MPPTFTVSDDARTLAPMTIDELEAAGAELAERLEKLSPGARITVGTPE
ncbi:hypothetical protein [Streptomyces sp. NBC_00057]